MLGTRRVGVRLASVVLVGLLFGACGGEQSETGGQELRSEFLAYLFPIDAAEHRAGWEAFVAPELQEHYDGLGQCLEQEGFRTFGAAVRTAPVGPQPREVWLFPDYNKLRDDGLNREAWHPALNTLFSVNGMEEPPLPDDPILAWFERHPDLGVRPTVEEVSTLVAAVSECTMSHPLRDEGVFASQVIISWHLELQELDADASLEATMADTVRCLRAIGPEFSDVRDHREWLGLTDGLYLSMDFDPNTSDEEMQAKLRAWGLAYADCVEVFDLARRELRLALRSERIDSDLTMLLDLQSTFYR